ncbi:heme/copper-type cytochrome/quinol oxidase subunit 3 [Pullulanibacillus pueri]|uniref:Cytochrome c oxidase subunit 3 n=1 Tax=Pullulanibacillus pueri TaxID=1437324 RepID=A0A8J2ZSW0_9BACL|nr:cytochrome (ubi)quinol oxidase subunit III [Pullulanibacillus pueri]MBM7680100.1 heme/copper-type cytochrome/quinol oxidase subunit 3 [Pullulanibacillus pueri]GGH74366.1 cytochrome c oxidase subunit 3 [Pullulanibacillus pueri]
MSETHTSIEKLANPEKATLEGKNKFLGFWFFLGGETVLFGTLFATFLALRDKVASGPSGPELFSITTTFISTMILLVSSLTSVFAVMAMKDNKLRQMQLWFWVTVLLGLCFLGLEIYEFSEYLSEGLGYKTSAFSSSFYTLVGTHGGHVFFGILWISTLMIASYKKGITTVTAPKYYVAALYWHFIDVVWVFIFTVVYLLGILGD